MVGVEETRQADEAKVCNRCGAFGDMPHGWTEGDCVLPHRNHSRKLVAGSFVCEHCVERHQEWLTEIVELYATLGRVLLAGSIPDDTAEHKRPRKQPASPSPLRLEAWAMLTGDLNTHLVEVTYGAEGRTETRRGLYMDGTLPDVPAILCGWASTLLGSTATTVSGAAAALTVGAEDAVRDPDVDDYDAELRWVRRCLRSAHGLVSPEPIGPCLTVTCKGRVWPVTGGRPKCDKCARRYDVHDIVRLHAQQRTAS